VLDAGELLMLAVDEITVAAPLAVPAVAAEEANANALADLPAFDSVSERVDSPDRLMARDARPLNRE
jgi:hypothetical protein